MIHAMGKLGQCMSPSRKMGTIEHAASRNCIGTCTTHEATAAATGWYMPSLTSFLSATHCW
jgi:hypothetical protein